MRNEQNKASKPEYGISRLVTCYSVGEEATPLQLSKGHKHKHREIMYVLKGESQYMYNNQSFDAVPGTVFFIDSWLPHATGYSRHDNDLIHLWIFLDRFNELSVSPIHVGQNGEYTLRSRPFELYPECGMLLTRRWNALMSIDNAEQSVAERYLREPFALMLDEIAMHGENLASPPSSQKVSVDAVIGNIQRYIRSHNACNCSLAQLEKLSGYDRFYLSHRFKQCTGLTIGRFINQVRLEYTQAAMQQGMSQKKIADALGFSSPSNFWNWLHKNDKTK